MNLTVAESEAVIKNLPPEKVANLIAEAEENLGGWDTNPTDEEVRAEMIRIVRFTDYRDLLT